MVWSFCKVCKACLMTMFQNSLWVPSSLVTWRRITKWVGCFLIYMLSGLWVELVIYSANRWESRMVTVDKACIFRRSRSQWKVDDVWWKEVLVLGVRAGKREEGKIYHKFIQYTSPATLSSTFTPKYSLPTHICYLPPRSASLQTQASATVNVRDSHWLPHRKLHPQPTQHLYI